jgi:hypothetical protein
MRRGGSPRGWTSKWRRAVADVGCVLIGSEGGLGGDGALAGVGRGFGGYLWLGGGDLWILCWRVMGSGLARGWRRPGQWVVNTVLLRDFGNYGIGGVQSLFYF